MRAADLRAVAEQFTVPSIQERLHRVATNYESLADDAEARLAGANQSKAKQSD